MVHTVTRPTHLAEIVRREPTHLVFYDASGIGEGGVLLNLSGSGTSLVWRPPWPPEVIKELISERNPEGNLTNSNLEIAALLLHEDTLTETCPAETISRLYQVIQMIGET